MDDRKLIYADDVINALCEASDGDAATIAAFMELVDKIPAVDALVLPCKVGDTVYNKFLNIVLTVKSIELRKGKSIMIHCENDETGECGTFSPEHINDKLLVGKPAEAALAERRADDA